MTMKHLMTPVLLTAAFGVAACGDDKDEKSESADTPATALRELAETREGLQVALADPRVAVHLYDKRRVFERRKMGHVAAVGASSEEALERARHAAGMISWQPHGTAEEGT